MAACAFIGSDDFDGLPCRRNYRERLLKVGDQVVNIFDSDREADELLGDSHFLAQVGGDHGMRGQYWD